MHEYCLAESSPPVGQYEWSREHNQITINTVLNQCSHIKFTSQTTQTLHNLHTYNTKQAQYSCTQLFVPGFGRLTVCSFVYVYLTG